MKDLNLVPKDFYIPHKNNIIEDQKIYEHNMGSLNDCDIMIAILDGKDVDSGTAFEIGYFTNQNKIVLGLLTDKRSYDEDCDLNYKLNTMIYGATNCGINVFSDIDDLIEDLYGILCEDI